MSFLVGEECCVSDGVRSEITCKSSVEDPDSGDEIPPAQADAPVHDIRCGLLVGKLHMHMFTCPGIHRRCIEFEGKLISPRQFTIKAEKDKQKDWKGSIRLGRYNLRTLMELKTLDFFEHATNCSLKCQSRNYIKNRKSEADSQSFSFLESISDSHTPNTDCYDAGFCDEMSGEVTSMRRKGSSALEDYVTQTVPSINGNNALACIGLRSDDLKMGFPCPPMGTPPITQLHPTTSNTPSSLDMNNDAALTIILQSLLDQQQQTGRQNFFNNLASLNTPNSIVNPNLAKLPPPEPLILSNDLNMMSVVENAAARRISEENAVTSVGNIKKIMESSPVLFWSRMKELGIVEDLLNILSTTVDQLKHIYLHGGQNTEEFAAQKLSSLANSLDLGLIYGEKIHGRYVQTTLESSLITKELQTLQRKAEEQKRKLETAKRKSQVFDQIIKNSEQPDMKKVHLNYSN